MYFPLRACGESHFSFWSSGGGMKRASPNIVLRYLTRGTFMGGYKFTSEWKTTRWIWKMCFQNNYTDMREYIFYIHFLLINFSLHPFPHIKSWPEFYHTWFSASVWFSKVMMTGNGDATKPCSLIAATQSCIQSRFYSALWNKACIFKAFADLE